MMSRGRALMVVVVAAAALAFSPSHALAYIGPGVGLTAIGSLLALLVAAVVALFGFVWYPLKRLIRMLKGKRTAADAATAVAHDQR